MMQEMLAPNRWKKGSKFRPLFVPIWGEHFLHHGLAPAPPRTVQTVEHLYKSLGSKSHDSGQMLVSTPLCIVALSDISIISKVNAPQSTVVLTSLL